LTLFCSGVVVRNPSLILLAHLIVPVDSHFMANLEDYMNLGDPCFGNLVINQEFMFNFLVE
jgi:hypothetical protein